MTVWPPPPPPPADCTVESLGSALGDAVASGVPWHIPGVVESCAGLGPEAVYVWVAPHAGTFQFDTIGSLGDTVLALRTSGCSGPEIECNDDSAGVQSRIRREIGAGEELYVIVDSFSESADLFQLNIRDVGALASECEPEDLGSATGLVASGTLPDADFGLMNDCGGIGRSAVYSWTPPDSAAYQINTVGSTFDTVLDVRFACDGQSLACNDDTTTQQSSLQLPAGLPRLPLVIVIQAYGGGDFSDVWYQLHIDPQ
jgi:hypothetical protein